MDVIQSPDQPTLTNKHGSTDPSADIKAGSRTIRLASEDLVYESADLDDPVPTGRQILRAFGRNPIESYLIFQVIGRSLKEIGLDETVDIRVPDVKAFVAFRSDRSYRFVLDDDRLEWGSASIKGLVLKSLAGVEPGSHDLWLEKQDGPDRLVADDDSIDLTGSDVERFYLRRSDRLHLIIFAPRYPEPKSFWFSPSILVGDAARQAATAFKYQEGSPGLQTLTEPPRVLDNSKTLAQEQTGDCTELELVDTGGGV